VLQGRLRDPPKMLLTRSVNSGIFMAMRTTKKPSPGSGKPSPQASDPQLGALLRSARESRGWTLDQLSKRLHVTKGYISRLEGGKARPAVQMVETLARTLRIDPNPILILAGHIPQDLGEILRSHPVEAASVLRESFGNSTYSDTSEPDSSPIHVREPEARYSRGTSGYELVEGDCFSWFVTRRPNTVHAIVTDPPYGLKEYTEQEK